MNKKKRLYIKKNFKCNRKCIEYCINCMFGEINQG